MCILLTKDSFYIIIKLETISGLYIYIKSEILYILSTIYLSNDEILLEHFCLSSMYMYLLVDGILDKEWQKDNIFD